jgi:putative acetyltransferase
VSVTIRPADNRDTDGIVSVIREVYDEYGFQWDAEDYHADLYDVDAHYTSQGDTFLVAESNEQIVGTAALTVFPTIPGPPAQTVQTPEHIRIGACDCSLERLYVSLSARRQGIGRNLFEAIIQDAKNRGCQNMELWSDKRFGEAHLLYQKLGASVVGERICHDPDQSPEWGLCLPLTERD